MIGRRIGAAAFAPATTIVALGIVSFLAAGLGQKDAVTVMLINVVLVVGLWIFVGNSGILSFGHISFMAIGAYLASILTIPVTTRDFLLPELPGVLSGADPGAAAALVIAMAVAAAFAFLVGLALMRLSGVGAGIATLSLLVIVTNVLSSWSALTGGGGTLTGIPVTTDVTAAFITAAGAIVVAFLFRSTPTGRRLRATREDLVAARALGVRHVPVRLAGFVVSAAVMAAGGWLYAHYLGSISAESFSFQTTFLVIAMLVVGGSYSLAGAVLGVVVVTALTEGMQHLESAGVLGAGWSTVVLAAAVILILIWRPRGLSQGREPRLPARWTQALEAGVADLTAPAESTAGAPVAPGGVVTDAGHDRTAP